VSRGAGRIVLVAILVVVAVALVATSILPPT
jgi:hypothetical protein